MKKSFFPVVLVFCLFITFFSCSNKPQRSRKPVSNITIVPVKKTYTYGEKVSVEVKTRLKNGEIENIELFYQGKKLKESKELEFTVTDVELNTLGNINFVATAVKTDGLKNTRTKMFSVVSDIIPQKFTYQTVNNYPHLTTSFTQGLEFKDGFLYEGTGENGLSALYKINLLTGNPIQSVKLDDKYFGEGITILGDKIYQLTYKAQKGFIYDFKTFALVDSFQYKSKQGWGLTNDGKYLIMSDSSHNLTWLDPDNFSVVKTVQVSNNIGIVNYLNELEYINKTIYANVYTTDIVVQIDPESGRVLSEINLSGILNMFKQPNDTTDVLNGIAYDKVNDRLFVTGKWWPRLFEIKLKPLE